MNAVCLFAALAMVCAGCDGVTVAASGGAGSTSSLATTGGLGCKLPFAGDPSKPIELTLVTRGPDLMSTELTEGGPAPMILPPQGGRVILVGVRAKNIDPCNVELLGSIRDTATQQVRIDQRTTNLRPAGDVAESAPADISTYANIPTCPNQWASIDVQGNLFEVTVSVTDRAGRTATKTLMAEPYCSEPEYEAECLCICQQGYVLGQMCP